MSEEEFVEAIFQRDLKIKKLNEKVKELENKYSDEEIRNTVLKRCNEVIEKDYVSKDKIKEKIKEIQMLDKKGIGFNYNSNQVLGLLQELLGDEDE